MIRMRTLIVPGLALAFALTLGAGSASADIQDYYLYSQNGSINVGPNPTNSAAYVKVEVDQTGAHTASITFTSLTNNGYSWLLTDGGSVAANLNIGSISISASDISVGTPTAPTGFSPTLSVENPPGVNTDDGWGNFNLRVSSGSAGTSSYSGVTINVNISESGAPVWTSAADVLSGNNKGNTLAAHIQPWAGAYDSHGVPVFGTASTGFVSGASTTPPPPTPNGVPEPSTMLIAAVGALGFLGYGLRRRRKG